MCLFLCGFPRSDLWLLHIVVYTTYTHNIYNCMYQIRSSITWTRWHYFGREDDGYRPTHHQKWSPRFRTRKKKRGKKTIGTKTHSVWPSAVCWFETIDGQYSAAWPPCTPLHSLRCSVLGLGREAKEGKMWHTFSAVAKKEHACIVATIWQSRAMYVVHMTTSLMPVPLSHIPRWVIVSLRS